MNQRDIRRAAHGSVAAFLDASSFDDGDLYVSTEGWSDEDLERFKAELVRIIEYHRRYA